MKRKMVWLAAIAVAVIGMDLTVAGDADAQIMRRLLGRNNCCSPCAATCETSCNTGCEGPIRSMVSNIVNPAPACCQTATVSYEAAPVQSDCGCGEVASVSYEMAPVAVASVASDCGCNEVASSSCGCESTCCPRTIRSMLMPRRNCGCGVATVSCESNCGSCCEVASSSCGCETECCPRTVRSMLMPRRNCGYGQVATVSYVSEQMTSDCGCGEMTADGVGCPAGGCGGEVIETTTTVEESSTMDAPEAPAEEVLSEDREA